MVWLVPSRVTVDVTGALTSSNLHTSIESAPCSHVTAGQSLSPQISSPMKNLKEKEIMPRPGLGRSLGAEAKDPEDANPFPSPAWKRSTTLTPIQELTSLELGENITTHLEVFRFSGHPSIDSEDHQDPSDEFPLIPKVTRSDHATLRALYTLVLSYSITRSPQPGASPSPALEADGDGGESGFHRGLVGSHPSRAKHQLS